jgi:outer membrane protein TolC
MQRLLCAGALLCLAATPLAAQRRDTVYLDALQQAAERADRRAAQIELLSSQSALRLQTIRNERLPSLNGAASAQYLSDVASVGAALPATLHIPTPHNDQYDASITARQPLLDPTRAKRVAVEAAQTAESAARVRSALWQQRQQVNDAFFALQLYDVQQRTIGAAISDLTSRRAAAQLRVDAGTALPSETLLLDAELARRRQSLSDIAAQRSAVRDVLASLTGADIPDGATLVVRGETAATPTLDVDRARPEYLQFDRTRDVIAARTSALAAQDLPRLSVFGRTGYGRPGLNALGQSFDTYWNAGVQLEWSPFNWGRTRRDMEAQRLQADIVRSDEAAFTESVRRNVISQRGQIAALEQSLAMDDSIVSLRERILREARLRHDEGELTSADYIARQTEQLSAQLDRDARRVRLSEARARLLTTLGHEVR